MLHLLHDQRLNSGEATFSVNVSKRPVWDLIYDPYDNLLVKYLLSPYALLFSFFFALLNTFGNQNPLNDLAGICMYELLYN